MTEREEFEVDVFESFGRSSLAQDKDGNYSDPTIADHWETWQTAWQAGRAPLLARIAELEATTNYGTSVIASPAFIEAQKAENRRVRNLMDSKPPLDI